MWSWRSLFPLNGERMTMTDQSSAKTATKATSTRKTVTTSPTTSGAPVPQTGQTAQQTASQSQSSTRSTTQSAQQSAQQPPKPLPEASPRNGVRVNVTAIETAFTTGAKTRSVAYIQYVLKQRGFDPGNTTGLVDHQTRAAYAEYQRSIDERPTGVPTDESLDHLGFDVVG